MEDEEKRKALVRLLAIQMKKDQNNWNKDGVEDQKIVDDLREYSNGVIDLKAEDLNLKERQQSHYNIQRKQYNQRRQQNNQRRRQQH